MHSQRPRPEDNRNTKERDMIPTLIILYPIIGILVASVGMRYFALPENSVFPVITIWPFVVFLFLLAGAIELSITVVTWLSSVGKSKITNPLPDGEELR